MHEASHTLQLSAFIISDRDLGIKSESLWFFSIKDPTVEAAEETIDISE
jgi:hypothetical protein